LFEHSAAQAMVLELFEDNSELLTWKARITPHWKISAGLLGNEYHRSKQHTAALATRKLRRTTTRATEHHSSTTAGIAVLAIQHSAAQLRLQYLHSAAPQCRLPWNTPAASNNATYKQSLTTKICIFQYQGMPQRQTTPARQCTVPQLSGPVRQGPQQPGQPKLGHRCTSRATRGRQLTAAATLLHWLASHIQGKLNRLLQSGTSPAIGALHQEAAAGQPAGVVPALNQDFTACNSAPGASICGT
jgi:hypothetical protein